MQAYRQTQRQVDLFSGGMDKGKRIITHQLGLIEPGPGYCHFPEGRDEEWYHQLTAEKLVPGT